MKHHYGGIDFLCKQPVAIMPFIQQDQPSYCLGFIYDAMGNRIMLQLKNRTWQAGRFNGIGGALKSGESPLDGMHREFNEEVESGLGPKKLFWKLGPVLEFKNGATVYVFFVQVSDNFFDRLVSATDEELVCYPLKEMPPHRLFVPHVAWLAQHGIALLLDENLKEVR